MARSGEAQSKDRSTDSFREPIEKEARSTLPKIALIQPADENNSSTKTGDAIKFAEPRKQEGHLASMLEGKGNPKDRHSLSYHIRESWLEVKPKRPTDTFRETIEREARSTLPKFALTSTCILYYLLHYFSFQTSENAG